MSFLSNIFGGGSQTVTQTLDPGTQRYVDYLRQQAQGYAAGRYPVPQDVQQAQQAYGQAGLLGLGSLTGQNQAFMNPYLQQMNPFWQQQRDIAQSAAQDYATKAGAFGGDRAALLQGQALSDISNQQAAYNTAQYNDAQQRALQTAQFGLAAPFLGQQYASGQLGLLNQGIGPYGMTQTTTSSQSPFQQLLGLGLMAGGALAGGPVGAAAAGQLSGGYGGGMIGGSPEAGAIDKMGYNWGGVRY